ncbi:MAG: pectate lyase [Blastocatellia bacterium]|nr:pectate lyase [Blastocatellia bacterium]
MKQTTVRVFTSWICFIATVNGFAGRAVNSSADGKIKWEAVLKQKLEWYSSDEAIRIADNVLLYQRDTGGWDKNEDMAAPLTERRKAELIGQKQNTDSNIDNGATYTQLAFLARVYTARKLERHREAFFKGVDYLLEAQYDNGGWPQYYPRLEVYYKRITFNDGAMIGVMKLLRDIAKKKSAYAFVDEGRRLRAEGAVQKGIECILKAQIVVRGKRTVWCAQHDEITLAPVAARRFEPASLSGGESVGIVQFLMSLDRPDERVIEAIESAVAWFERVKITGIRWIEKVDASNPDDRDRAIVRDPNARPLWARFYEIGTDRPIFAGRDGIIKYDVAEIEEERRNGYQWYSDAPASLLDQDYPAWRRRIEKGI